MKLLPILKKNLYLKSQELTHESTWHRRHGKTTWKTNKSSQPSEINLVPTKRNRTERSIWIKENKEQVSGQSSNNWVVVDWLRKRREQRVPWESIAELLLAPFPFFFLAFFLFFGPDGMIGYGGEGKWGLQIAGSLSLSSELWNWPFVSSLSLSTFCASVIL